MARIDLYINSLSKFGATGVLLRSGENVMIRFPTGDRYATQVLRHPQLVEIVREIASGEAQAFIDRGEAARFHYDVGGSRYEIEVRPKGEEAWEVELSPGAAVAEWPFEEPPPGAAAGASDGEKLGGLAGGSGASTARSKAQSPPQSTAEVSPEVRAGAPSGAGGFDGGAGEARSLASEAEPVRAGEELGGAHAPSGGSSSARAGEAGQEGAAGAAAGGPASGAQEASAARRGGDPPAVRDLLVHMSEVGASDLHVSSGAPPYMRVHGRMEPVKGAPPCDPDELLRQLYELAPEKNRHEFEERSDTDFAYAIPGAARYRVNMFRDRRGPGAVMRSIPYEILRPEQIGLPQKALELCYLTKGLVLVTGPTGSGKSTTLATLVDHINENRYDHIISIEDPIEFVHENKRCLVNQREVQEHTRSFKNALRAALREDPDVVLVGELRDLETIAIAIETAETGHLVFGTLHTSTAPSTVDRVIDQFPADQQEQIRQMLAESLKGVIAQTLLRRKGGGRVAAYEVLMGSSAVSNLIREGKTFQLFSMMQTGRSQGMMTLNDSLLQLVKSDLVEPSEAYAKAVNKAEFENLLRREGLEP